MSSASISNGEVAGMLDDRQMIYSSVLYCTRAQSRSGMSAENCALKRTSASERSKKRMLFMRKDDFINATLISKATLNSNH